MIADIVSGLLEKTKNYTSLSEALTTERAALKKTTNTHKSL